MMHNMMPVMGPDALFWIVGVSLLCLMLVVAFIWLFISWLKYRRSPATPQYPSQLQDSYQEYAQGYQPQEQTPETYEEGGQSYPATTGDHKGSPLPPQYEQPEVQYPPTMPYQR
jgi:hypothetical protein